MKKVSIMFVVLWYFVFFTVGVKAEQIELSEEDTEEVLIQQIEKLPLADVEKEIEQIWEKRELPSFGECIKKSILEGSFINFEELFGLLIQKLSGEIMTQIAVVKKIIFVVLLSAILKNINASFAMKSVGELGFYVCYMVLIVVITAAFYSQTDMVGNTIRDVETFFKAMLPVFVTLSMTSGGYGQATVTAPAVMAGAGILTHIVCNGILPAVVMTASLEMINHISEKPMLERFTKLFQGGISWGMKGIAFLFVALLSLQKLGGSVLSRGIGKTAKAVVTSVPVVGDVMGGAVDTVGALIGMIRGGTLITVVIFMALICAVPLIRLCIMILIYKLTAAVVEPICESRLVKCISSAGDFSVLLFGALFLVESMFLFSAVLLLTFF